MSNRYDSKLKEDKARIKHNFNVKMQDERLKFEMIHDKILKPRIAYGRWINALTNDRFTWQLTITFPHKLLKDDKMKRFKEEILIAFQKIYGVS